MQERVEVFSNPRVDLTASQMRKAFAPAKKRRKSSGASNPKKKKKKKRGKKRAAKVPILQLLIGAAVTAALEVYVFRNKDYEDSIPAQVRQYSGAIMAVAGVLAATMLKGKMGRQIRPGALGMAAAGAFLQLSDQLVQMREDAVLDATRKWSTKVDLTKTGTDDVDGLGRLYGHRYPAAPNMTAAQAAAALGMQSRIPYHPYGLGTFDYSSAPGQRGLGVFVGGPTPIDPSLDPILDPGGLGDLVDSGEAGAWLEGQFAFSDSDYREAGW